MLNFDQKSRLERLTFFEKRFPDNPLYFLREDELHPQVSGNKFRKLKYNLEEAVRQDKKRIVTFGGAYSNHIAATAAAAELFGLKSLGIIRGDELGKDMAHLIANNSTLAFAHSKGMQFDFWSREKYRNKEAMYPILEAEYPEAFIVPEGGTNHLAVKGTSQILDERMDNFKHIAVAMGTGGTLSGILNASQKHQFIHGFPALKSGGFLQEEVEKYSDKTNFRLHLDYHFGGYARYDENLITFINDFKRNTDVPLDPIYTGKMVFGLHDLLEKGYFPSGESILMIHTGGLQGIDGFNNRLNKKSQTLRIE